MTSLPVTPRNKQMGRYAGGAPLSCKQTMGRFEEVLQDRLSNLKTHSIYLGEDRAINLNSSDTSDRHTQQKHTSSATTSMKPDALAALATKTMRPQALEAAVVADPEQEKQATTDSRDQQQVCIPVALYIHQILTRLSIKTKTAAQIRLLHLEHLSAQTVPGPQPS